MRKLCSLIIILCLCCVVVIGCTGKKITKESEGKNGQVSKIESVSQSENTQIVDPALTDPVVISLLDYSSKGATFIMANQTDDTYDYGADYELSVLVNDEWQPVPYIIDNWGFAALGYELAGQEVTKEITIDWTWLYGELPDGEYRITKRIINQGTDSTVSAIFELVDGKPVAVASYTIVKTDAAENIVSQTEIVDNSAMKTVEEAIFDVLVKSARFQVDTSEVNEFYYVKTNYNNGETSEMLYYVVNEVAYGDGTVCSYDKFEKMIALVNA